MVTAIKKLVAQHLALPEKTLSVSPFFHGAARPDKKILFLVTDGEEPVCMLKVVRDPKHNALLEREGEGQAIAREHLSSYSVPKIFFKDRLGEHVVYAEEVADGVPVGLTRGKANLKSVYQYQNEIPKGGIVTRGDLVALFGTCSCDNPRFQELRAQFKKITKDFFSGWSHGDLTYMNLITGPKATFIIDWERFGERPLWGIDFVHYMRRCFEIRDSKSFEQELTGLEFISAEDKAYFVATYFIDEMMDILQKSCPKDYARVSKTLAHERH